MRRIMMLIWMGLAFYAGLYLERELNDKRCTTAGGVVTEDRLCVGAKQ